MDLRWTWISSKLKKVGYQCHWYGKGHTGYKSMAHLPTRNGFEHFVGFLTGSQSYTSTDRWEDEHPMTTDKQFTNPPMSCVPGGDGSHSISPPPLAGCDAIKIYKDKVFIPDDKDPGTSSPTANATECCSICDQANVGNTTPNTTHACSHWSWLANASGTCVYWAGRVTASASTGSTSGVMFHPPPPGPGPKPSPSPPPPGDTHCHANTYSSTLYGEIALQAVRAHDPSVPMFLYFPFQAVHGPYDHVPFWTGNTYM
jgi:hypothetical protein